MLSRRSTVLKSSPDIESLDDGVVFEGVVTVVGNDARRDSPLLKISDNVPLIMRIKGRLQQQYVRRK
jgi:hypothetical protein